MIIDIVMPKMGESITEGTILEWRKKVGEFVEKDELFLEIGTDKVDSEIPCVESGTLVEILAEVNEVVDVGKTIAKIETKTTAEGKNKTLDHSSKEKEVEKVSQEKIQTPVEQTVPPNKNSAKAFAVSVFPTPEGPKNINDPEGLLGSFRPDLVLLIALETADIASS